MLNEEKKKPINLSSNNLYRIIAPNTQPEAETVGQSNIPEESNNILILKNNKITETDISNNNNKTKTNSNNRKRKDKNGNIICRHGKQRISFIDKINNKNLVDIINIDSFKQYNKIEEVSYIVNNNKCCIVI